jgi:hypothetical protein
LDVDDGDVGLLPEVLLAIGFFSPQRAEVIRKYLEDRGQLKRQRLTEFADVAEEATGLAWDDLVARASENPRKSDLLERVLRRAVETESADKIRALARVLRLVVSVADDGAAVDEVWLILAALDDVDPPHLRVLARLNSHGGHHAFREDDLVRLFPNGSAVLYPLLKTLERHGLVREVSADAGQQIFTRFEDGQPRWEMSDFGRTVLAQLFTFSELTEIETRPG